MKPSPKSFFRSEFKSKDSPLLRVHPGSGSSLSSMLRLCVSPFLCLTHRSRSSCRHQAMHFISNFTVPGTQISTRISIDASHCFQLRSQELKYLWKFDTVSLLFVASALQVLVPMPGTIIFSYKSLHEDLTDGINTRFQFQRSDFEIRDKYTSAPLQHGFQLFLLLTISLKWDFIQPNLKMKVYHRTSDGQFVICYMPVLLKLPTSNLIKKKKKWNMTSNTVSSSWKDLGVFPHICVTRGQFTFQSLVKKSLSS